MVLASVSYDHHPSFLTRGHAPAQPFLLPDVSFPLTSIPQIWPKKPDGASGFPFCFSALPCLSILPGRPCQPARSSTAKLPRTIQCYFNKTFLRAQPFFGNIIITLSVFLKYICIVYVICSFSGLGLVYFYSFAPRLDQFSPFLLDKPTQSQAATIGCEIDSPSR